MGGEDGCNVDLSLLGEGQGDTSEPLVEVGNNGLVLLMTDKLLTLAMDVSVAGKIVPTSPKNHATK